MKPITILLLPFLLISFAFKQQEPLKKEDLIKPKELAQKIKSKASPAPIIFNVGPMEQIKTAIKIGATNTDAGLSNLKAGLLNISTDREVIIYCGCCTSENCPNIRPGLAYLKKNGYKNAKIIEITTGLKVDWIEKGYPMQL